MLKFNKGSKILIGLKASYNIYLMDEMAADQVLSPLMQQHQQLASSFRLLDEVVNAIDEGILLKDMDGNFVHCNQQALTFLEFTAPTLLGTNCRDIAYLFCKQDLSAYLYEEVPTVITMLTGQPRLNEIMGVQLRNEVKWASFSSRVIRIQDIPYVLVTFFDVSELVIANQRLAEKEHNLQLMVSSLNDIVLETDRNGTILHYWTSKQDLFFLPPESFLHQQMDAIFPEPFVIMFKELIARVLHTRQPLEQEYQSPFDDSSQQWFKARINPIPGVEGKVVIVISDFTEQRHTREKLIETETRWRFALEGTGQGIWDWRVDTGEVFYSDLWKRLFGYDLQELNSSTVEEWYKLVHPDDAKGAEENLQAYFNGMTSAYRHEHRMRCKDGSWKWVLEKGMVIERDSNGAPVRMVGTAIDITERVENLKQIRLSEQKFHSAFNHSGIGMAIVSTAGEWLEVNDNLCAILGYTQEELKRLTFMDITYDDDLAQSIDLKDKLLRKEIDNYSLEKRYRHKNGHLIWILLTVSLVRNSDDSPRYFISQIQDISHQKELMLAMERKNSELVLTTFDLEQKIKQLEEFNQIVAHNLRSPASNIKMLLHEIRQTDSETDKNEYFALLDMSSDALIETLQELIDILEIRLNKHLPFEQCDVAAITQKIIHQHNASILEKSAVIDTQFNVATISYPKVYLESILHNLISNALKYSQPGIPPLIRITTSIENNHTVLTVSDNGLGIDLEKFGQHLFKFRKIFHRGFDSKGFGLFMTKNQIETLGGKIAVESKPGTGTTFKVTF